jgi:hypothetical protein
MKRLLLLSLLSLIGCKKAPAESGELTPVELPGHPVTTLPDPELQDGHVGRAPRRLTVAQLKASILTTTGRQWSQIDNLATSLGRADFAVVASENTEPNLVFAKFLEDGAREVCLATALADLSKPLAADRVLSKEVPDGVGVTDLRRVSADDVKKNLTSLSLRFWGTPLQGAELEKWSGTFTALAARAHTINRREQGWGAVCVAMMTDPRFLTY